MPKKWGQHFLIQPIYIEKILETAQVSENDPVLEIGPGKGILTEGLLRQKAWVTALEIDPKLHQLLEQRFHEATRLSLLQQDILKCEPQFLAKIHPPPYKVVANLPYNIATPIFFKLLAIRASLQSVTVMVQKEVAERICATVEQRAAYGALAVAAHVGFQRRMAFSVPPAAFSPPPKVESAVVHLIPKPCFLEREAEAAFLKWVQCVFNQRRKTLLNNLQRCCPQEFEKHEKYLKSHYAQKRTETLAPSELMELYDRLFSF